MALLILLVWLLSSAPASADTITWKADSEVFSVNDPANFWPGLVSGTPWSLTVSFDPAGPAAVISPGCNQYTARPATLLLGEFSYTHSTGQIYTNAALPEIGCIGSLPEGESGLIQFVLGAGDWTQQPGAWDLNVPSSALFAGYYDLIRTDGTLPAVPVFDPNQGPFGGLTLQMFPELSSIFGGQVRFQPVDQSTPVPEPAAMTLLGAGLAAILARRRIRLRQAPISPPPTAARIPRASFYAVRTRPANWL